MYTNINIVPLTQDINDLHLLLNGLSILYKFLTACNISVPINIKSATNILKTINMMYKNHINPSDGIIQILAEYFPQIKISSNIYILISKIYMHTQENQSIDLKTITQIVLFLVSQIALIDNLGDHEEKVQIFFAQFSRRRSRG